MIGIRSLTSIAICAFFVIAYSYQNINENKKSAQTRSVQSIEELKTKLKNVLKDMHVPGMSIAIVHREGPILVAGLGKSDLTNDKAATESTLFRIGSVSKGFISLAILKLVDEGKLSLEDSVKKLVPEIWFENKWERSDPVRIVHLLENTTGWDDMHLREFAKSSSTMSFIDTLNYDHSSRISRWRPGTRMAYCNSGPAVAAYIVEKIVGKSFEDYIEQTFFKLIGMQTATYFQPISHLTTTLYRSDGKTPYSYWNLLYRSIGSINASAKDMANYLLFYLKHGNIFGIQVIPVNIFNRIEAPSSTWAAKEGLRVGYGLSNYCTIYDGFVYHGHDGNIPGSLTAMQYMFNEGIGYFYSLNSDNRKAFDKIGKIIRTYITHQLQKPFLPAEVPLTEKTNTYTGWYETNSPRLELFHFLERLFGLTYVHFKDNKLILNSLGEKKTFIPVKDTEFRYAPTNEYPDTLPTLKLLSPNVEGQFLQLSLGLRNPDLLHITMKRIPTWLAIFEIIIMTFVLLTFMLTLVYMPFWILQDLRKKYSSAEHSIQVWPMVAMLSLLFIVLIFILSNDVGIIISRMGNLTVWSFSVFLATIVFAVASVFSIIALCRTHKAEVRNIIYIYSTMISIALIISTAYFAYWGVIGLRTWA